MVVLAVGDDEDDYNAASGRFPEAHTPHSLYHNNPKSGQDQNQDSRNDDIDVEGAGVRRVLQTRSPYATASASATGGKKNRDRSKRPDAGVAITGPLQGLNVNLHSAQSLADTLDVIKSQKGVKLLNFAYIKLDSSKLLGQGSFSKVYR